MARAVYLKVLCDSADLRRAAIQRASRGSIVAARPGMLAARPWLRRLVPLKLRACSGLGRREGEGMLSRSGLVGVVVWFASAVASEALCADVVGWLLDAQRKPVNGARVLWKTPPAR